MPPAWRHNHLVAATGEPVTAMNHELPIHSIPVSAQQTRRWSPSSLSPKQLLLLLAVIIFVAELLDMLLLTQLPPMPALTEALIDSCILLMILAPVYHYLYRPFWRAHQRAEEENRRLSRQLIRAEEATRKALARDLHDEFGQTLSALQLEIDTLMNTLPSGDEKPVAQCRRLSAMTAQLGAHVRDVTAQLRPSMLDSLGLIPTIRWHVGQFQLRHAGMRVIADLPERELKLPAESAVALYRVLQESLTNVARHALAGAVHISLHVQAGRLTLLIEDNGSGFDLAGLQTSAGGDPSGIGIPGMRERIADLGGTLTLNSRPGEGTAVRVDMLLNEEGGA